MWLNNMPTISLTGASPRKGHHIVVHIKRHSDSLASLSDDAPKVLKVHVIQASKVEDLSSLRLTAEDNSDSSRYYSWDGPQLLGDAVSARATDERAARQQHFVLTRPKGWRGAEDEIEINAWDGPSWEGGLDFIAFVEFEGGQVLRTDVQTADIVS
ncbi:hypothetical protein FRC19_009892 [Serendipita sp. 401]|nr:hypothetical protein FRC15_009578 [Serendipita sp. 397]KAG8828036.1 hypothetical protein FRC19_009892 [Serendipita sp. 401]KAG9058341.1 hypothetical protein FS842_010067 [Serendipita sp. 407]